MKAKDNMEHTGLKKLTFSFPSLLHVLSALIPLLGCASSTITSTAVHQPVMLGDVKKSGSSGNIQEFDITIAASGWNTQTTSQQTEGTHKIDAELQKRISSAKDKIIIEEINFEYDLVFIAGIFGIANQTNSVGLKGAVLKAEQGNKTNARVEGKID